MANLEPIRAFYLFVAFLFFAISAGTPAWSTGGNTASVVHM